MIKERIELMPSNLFAILLLSLTRMRTNGTFRNPPGNRMMIYLLAGEKAVPTGMGNV